MSKLNEIYNAKLTLKQVPEYDERLWIYKIAFSMGVEKHNYAIIIRDTLC